MLHPIEFKKKWNLTYIQLAAVLQYESEFTVRSWSMQGKNHRNPPGVVQLACALLDEKWAQTGRPQNFLT